MSDEAPGGLSLEAFKAFALEIGDWVWGTAKGAFNEKATASQIIADAALSMVPAVGDVTGIRDLIAVVMGLVKDPRKREEKLQWIFLVIMLLGLIPVLGGAFKGIGRLVVKAMGEVAHLAAGAERAAKLAEAAKDIVALLNRIGVGSAEAFLKSFNFAEHQAALLKHLDELTARILRVLERIKVKFGSWVPDRFVQAIESIEAGLAWLKSAAPPKLTAAAKELDDFLHEIQAYIRSGGETTSRTTAHAAEAGAKQVHRVDELILLEGRAAKRTAKGGWAANSATPADDIPAVYKPEPGFPDLLKKKGKLDDGSPYFPEVASYAGQVVNRELQPGEKIFRIFGPEGYTHGVPVGKSWASGPVGGNSFWGLNDVPGNARDWRLKSAVLDEWNHDHFIVVGTVLPGHTVPACTGIIAEQSGKKLGMQYLEGGAKQAILNLPADVAKDLGPAAELVQKTGKEVVIESGGIRWELRPTGWSEANGSYGYGRNVVSEIDSQTERLAPSQVVSKKGE